MTNPSGSDGSRTLWTTGIHGLRRVIRDGYGRGVVVLGGRCGWMEKILRFALDDRNAVLDDCAALHDSREVLVEGCGSGCCCVGRAVRVDGEDPLLRSG